MFHLKIQIKKKENKMEMRIRLTRKDCARVSVEVNVARVFGITNPYASLAIVTTPHQQD